MFRTIEDEVDDVGDVQVLRRMKIIMMMRITMIMMMLMVFRCRGGWTL